MPSVQSRQQLQTEEMYEFPITGPFGGVQSELPLTEIEALGFADTTNIMFRKGAAFVRPGYTALPKFPDPINEPILGIVEFFNSHATRIQAVFTPTRLLQWNGTGWTVITGPSFTGTTQTFAWDVIRNVLCFTQGLDPVMTWDGIASSYSLASVDAVAANNLAEIGLHVMLLDTVESGVRFPQRYRWSGAGNPNDWTSFDSGLNDNYNNLGPGNGLVKLGQYGFGFHEWGIVQIVPTGVGTAPFAFYPIVNCSLGNIARRSLDHFNQQGVEQAVFVAEDNVYVFNQSSLIPIGDRPIDGQKRYGARSRIFADLFASDPTLAYGYVTTAVNGQPYNAYWLNIPMISTWVYNFDEGNWTVFKYDRTVVSAGSFYKGTVPRIIDLVGTIQAQNWTPITLAPTNPFDSFALGFNDGTVGYIDFTNYSELPWQIVSAKHTFGDRRHGHTVKKFRLVVLDNGAVTYTVTLTNESNVSQTQVVTIGTGSGDVLSQVLTFSITGLRIQWTVSGPAGVPGAMVEFCPIFKVAGEQRGGVADAS